MLNYDRTTTSLPLIITILGLVVVSLINPSFSATLCNPNDQKALLEIQTHFNEFDIHIWNASTDCCTWDIYTANVKCNADGRVTHIFLEYTIEGPIPAAFGDLTYLESLQILSSLNGTIPKSFTKLVNLKTLDLSENRLSGRIPNFLGQLKNLTYLNLGSNLELTGEIPSSLALIPNLKYLYLRSNKLTGPIPEFLTKMESLVELDITANPMTGTVPPAFSDLPDLTLLYLSECELTGSIPDSFGYFKNSNFSLSLYRNRLTGSIPRSLGRVNFRDISLGLNKLTGDASFLFGSDKTMLTSIDLGPNHLKFNFSKVDLPQGLRQLTIPSNKIYGSLPKRLGQLPLQYIDVSDNKLCGPIPTGRRLKQFSPNFFAGNKCLCGPPLPPCKS